MTTAQRHYLTQTSLSVIFIMLLLNDMALIGSALGLTIGSSLILGSNPTKVSNTGMLKPIIGVSLYVMAFGLYIWFNTVVTVNMTSLSPTY